MAVSSLNLTYRRGGHFRIRSA